MNPYADALNFAGRSVLVIGGASGIGAGIARAFAQCGAKVHVWGRRPRGEIDETRIAGLSYRSVDVTDAAAIEAAAGSFSTLDVLILSQGAVAYKRAEFGMTGFTQVVAVNLNSLMACALALRPQLAAARGALIAISSTGAYKAVIGNPAYAASKAGTLGLVRSLAAAWAADGIRTNGIAPGLIDTPMTKVTTDRPDRLAAMLAEIPAGRLGLPADIAGAALFLASPLASYILGQTIIVDGGSLL